MEKLLPIVSSLLLYACAAHVETQTTFTENTDIFPNPGQGWERYSNENTPSINKVNFGAGYMRYRWCHLEPEEGKYNWKPIDDAIESFAKDGLPFYFRIRLMPINGCRPNGYSTKGQNTLF